jgi:hypothetical protein
MSSSSSSIVIVVGIPLSTLDISCSERLVVGSGVENAKVTGSDSSPSHVKVLVAAPTSPGDQIKRCSGFANEFHFLL